MASRKKTHDSSVDLLDARAQADVNFLTGKPYSQEYRELASAWSRLPVYAKQTEVVSSIRDHQVTIIVSGTGSGKTVIVPKLALLYATPSGGRVVVTNPKSSITYGNADFAARTLDARLGMEVGYAYRGAPVESQDVERTRLLFVTDGYLLAQSRSDPTFKKYAVVIIDEVHERTVAIDGLIFRLKTALRDNPSLRVVLMSATIDTSAFERYFQAAATTHVNVLSVSGAPNFGVKSVFLRDSTSSDMLKDNIIPTVQRAMTTATAKKNGTDVLAFVPTVKDAIRGCELLRTALSCGKQATRRFCDGSVCLSLHRNASTKTQADIKSRSTPGTRRAVFSTNVAESSLTIPGLQVVVDSGFQLTSTFVPRYHAYFVKADDQCTQAQIRQRMGRVGRTEPGVCYHMYTREDMDSRPQFPPPSIQSVDLTDDVIARMRSSSGDVVSFEETIREFSEFPTPNIERLSQQLAGTARFMRFYKLLRNTHDASSQLTRLGRTVADVMRFCRLGAWNALCVVAGMAIDDLEPGLALAVLLDETNGGIDVAALFDKKKHDDDETFDDLTHLDLWRIYTTFRDRKNLVFRDRKLNIEALKALSSRIEQSRVFLTSERTKRWLWIHADDARIAKRDYVATTTNKSHDASFWFVLAWARAYHACVGGKAVALPGSPRVTTLDSGKRGGAAVYETSTVRDANGTDGIQCRIVTRLPPAISRWVNTRIFEARGLIEPIAS